MVGRIPELSIIKRHLCDYILEHPDKFNSNHCTVYIRSQGVKLTWKLISKIINEDLIANNLVEFDKRMNGYRLIGTAEDLKATLNPNTVIDIHRCVGHDNVINVIAAISEFIKSMEHRKRLF